MLTVKSLVFSEVRFLRVCLLCVSVCEWITSAVQWVGWMDESLSALYLPPPPVRYRSRVIVVQCIPTNRNASGLISGCGSARCVSIRNLGSACPISTISISVQIQNLCRSNINYHCKCAPHLPRSDRTVS